MNSNEILKMYLESNTDIYSEIIQAILNIKSKLKYKFDKKLSDDNIKLNNYLTSTCKISK